MTAPVDPNRYADMRLKLACLHCGSSGMIPWKQLDRVLFCRNCEILFRVEPHGLVEIALPQRECITVQVRGNASQWQGHQAVIEPPPTLGQRTRVLAASLAANWLVRVAAGCAVVCLVAASFYSATRQPAPPAPFQPPSSLTERAILWTEALVRRDLARLILLTEPSEHRALRIWLAHGEDVPAPVSASDQSGAAEIKILKTTMPTTAGDNAQVRVLLQWGKRGARQVLDQTWVKKGTAWYFRPVRLRSTLAMRTKR